MVVSPAVELALRRALVGEVPEFVRAVTAESTDGKVTVVTVYHLSTIEKGWRREFEEVVEGEFEQHLPKEERPKVVWEFRGADEFKVNGPVCVLHVRH